MKRALAERAKKSGHPTGLAPPLGDTTPTPPPQKVPRIQRPTAVKEEVVSPQPSPRETPSSAVVASSSAGTTTPRRSSSKRELAAVQQDENDDQGAFYLKHQNRALASELKALRYQVKNLENERFARRRHVQDARQAVQELASTWTQMEVALQQRGGSGSVENQPATVTTSESNSSGGNASLNSESIPVSTGTGKSVEHISALLDALAHLPKIKSPSNSKDEQQPQFELSKVSLRISQRAIALQQWIWSLLQQINDASSSSSGTSSNNEIFNVASLKGEVEALTLQCKDYEAQIEEMAKSRDEALDSDRRVRRGLYRLSVGRMKLEEVMKAVEDDDKDGMIALMALENNVKQSPLIPEPSQSSDSAVQQPVDGAQLEQLKKQLLDAEEISKSRDKQIEQLIKDREDHEKRINSLLLEKSSAKSESATVSDNDVRKSSLFIDTTTKLTSAEHQVEQMGEQIKLIKEQWGVARGDAETAVKTVEELEAKHKKRWAELVHITENNDNNGGNDDEAEEEAVKNIPMMQQARQIAELQHKLQQALENVRQAETVRMSLTETLRINEGLQSKVEELKTKNLALMESKSASRASSAEKFSSSSVSTPSSKEKQPSASSREKQPSASSIEKLERDNRKFRKELLAMQGSKENAKIKAERAEKERDALVKTNSRILKQSAEKDDMNAKSLSTILHLKNLTDQLEQEKALLEQKAKSSQQLALAARLATNAKERVGEEAIKEKKEMEEKLSSLEQKCKELQEAKVSVEGQLSLSKTQMASLEKDIESSKQRCNELVEEATKAAAEKRSIIESLAVAQRESAASLQRVANLSKSSSGGAGHHSEFTTEELSTQVSVLKGRLACPVCNVRDKKCILLRCRHMFCKQCVEENIRNRSRKCPACGQRFDNKDVADVWL